MMRMVCEGARCGGRVRLAAKAFGALHSLIDTVVGPVAFDRLLADRTMALVRRSAREIDVELAIRDGADRDPLDLLRELRELLATGRSGSTTPAGPRLRHGELTRREIEILTLVGQGRSDPEIAEALFISPKTASVHVANIKGKLGLDSRLEVALKARELGLV